MKLIHENKGLKVFLTNTKAINRNKRLVEMGSVEKLVEPSYSLYLDGKPDIFLASGTGNYIKERFNTLTNRGL